MMATFKDQAEDSELRIAAYLAVMTCPDDVILQQVQVALDAEKDQQVRGISCLITHMNNLQDR